MSLAETQWRRRIARKAAQQALANLGRPVPQFAMWASYGGVGKVEACDTDYAGWNVHIQKVENGGFVLNCMGKQWYAKDHDDLKEVFIEALVRWSVSNAL